MRAVHKVPLEEPTDTLQVCCAAMDNSRYAGASTVVIDTQIVMEWLVFKDAKVAPLAQALEVGLIHWIGSPSMLGELRHVLGRGIAAKFSPDLPFIEKAFSQHCRTIEAPPLPAVRLVCRDPNDQMFIDLAIAAQARWLISRDRDVLALAKRARAAGLAIITPEAWIKQQPTP